jgi:gliding motility-associated protein GldM
MALPKEPRQKMINIMYLVLTAILALNVSSEILNAFKTFDKSFKNSNNNMEARIKNLIDGFDQQSIVERFPEKVAIWKPRAEKIRDLSNTVFKYIETLKLELKKESGQKNPNDSVDSYKEDDLEASTRMFTNGKPGETKGEQLYNILAKYKKDLAAIDISISNQINSLPDITFVSDNIKKEYSNLSPAQQFANAYFHMTPTVAAIAMLTKFQNDVKNSEIFLIENCYAQLSAVPFVPTFGVVASASSAFVMTNDELSISAGLGAFAKDAQPIVTIDGANVPIDANGQAVLKVGTSSAGEFTKNVSITYIDPRTNKKDTKTALVKYKVGTPTGLSLSTDKTRVFYIGAPGGNPVKISGAAGGAGTLNVSIASGPATISKVSNQGDYIVTTTAEGDVVLNVSDGKNSLQGLKVPSKKMPPPKFAFVYGVATGNPRGGTISADAFKKQQGIGPQSPSDFVFGEIKYTIKSFKVEFSGKGFNGIETARVSNTGSFNSIRSFIDRCDAGSYVSISEIVALDAGGQDQKIESPIVFNLK